VPTLFHSKYSAVVWTCRAHAPGRRFTQRPKSIASAAEGFEERLMKEILRFTLAATLLVAVLQVLAVAQADSMAQATPVVPCDMRLRVELTPDVPEPLNPGFVSSLLGNHPDYRLTLQGQDPTDLSVITLDLAGPGPEAGCREVVNSMRRDARVQAVEVQADATGTTPAGHSAQPMRGVPSVTAVQFMGTLHAGPDGDWILEPIDGVPYALQARDRYECDLWAVDQTGFDPTQDDGGVPPGEMPGKRTDYLRAEATCLQSRGYLMR
jgi:hypothetical protein